MMREAGLTVPPDPEAIEKLKEIEYLRKAIGATGMMALRPLLPQTTRDVWQVGLVKS
jgi:hypothetical protein